jgi:hypothetical protein
VGVDFNPRTNDMPMTPDQVNAGELRRTILS